MSKTNVLLFAVGFLLAIDIAIEGVNFIGSMRNALPAVSQASEGTTIDIANAPIQGNARQELVLVEFSDFECPYCTKFATNEYHRIKEAFVDAGHLRYAFVNLALVIHPNARLLAQAGVCATAQGNFWGMRDHLFERQARTREDVISIANDLDLRVEAFEVCLDAPETSVQIESDIAAAEAVDVMATPGFAIGRIDANSIVTVDTFIRGAQPFEVFADAIADVGAANGR